MPQANPERQSYFNLVRGKVAGFQAHFELLVNQELRGGGAYFGDNIKACEKSILDTMSGFETTESQIEGLPVMIKSIQSRADQIRELQPLSQEELKGLVDQLNEQRHNFQEGMIETYSPGQGIER